MAAIAGLGVIAGKGTLKPRDANVGQSAEVEVADSGVCGGTIQPASDSRLVSPRHEDCPYGSQERGAVTGVADARLKWLWTHPGDEYDVRDPR